MKFKLLSLVFLSGVVALGCAYKHRPMNSPEVEIINKVSLNQVQMVVKRVLTVIGWKVESETAGVTVASIKKEALFAKIKVEYTPTEIKINYVDSQNLNYRNVSGKGETIHSRYLNWVNNLADKLSRAINTLPAN